jgi:mannose-6-phosphate isomerase-like protein (cupin superfamily)
MGRAPWQGADMPRFAIAQLDALPAVGCPCGLARRAFGELPEGQATVHLVDIRVDAKTHHHQRTTEIYVVLEGEGELELDGVRVPVKPLTAVYIQPGCRHRAVGRLRLLNIPIPPFDPADEFLEPEESR